MIVHCDKCQHEWEAMYQDVLKCDWCGAGGHFIGKSWYDTKKGRAGGSTLPSLYEFFRSLPKQDSNSNQDTR